MVDDGEDDFHLAVSDNRISVNSVSDGLLHQGDKEKGDHQQRESVFNSGFDALAEVD